MLGQGRAEPADHVHPHKHRVHPDAGKAGSGGIETDGGDLPSDRRAVQHEPERREDRGQHGQLRGDAVKVTLPQGEKGGGEPRVADIAAGVIASAMPR